MGSEQMIGSAAHAMILKSNFGIKSFYPKIGGARVDTKIWFKKKGPQSLNPSKESQNIKQGSANRVAIRMTSSFQRNGPYQQDQQA